jgi:hypothetical protein
MTMNNIEIKLMKDKDILKIFEEDFLATSLNSKVKYI